jgi:cytosine/uracil/thiamine/allantoin permease
MMENGNGSSKARAGVFFLAAGFAFTAMFENICGNAIAGGIDLAGLFPLYISEYTPLVSDGVDALMSALSRYTSWRNHYLRCSLDRPAVAAD